MYQRRNRFRRVPQRAGGTIRTFGLCLMLLGALLVVLFVPFEVWLAIIGAILVVLGFIMWRCF